MSNPLLLASIDRAGDHAIVVGVVAAVAAVGWLVRAAVSRNRSRRAPSDGDSDA